MSAIVLPEPMIQFLQKRAEQHGFADASAYLQSVVQELQDRQAPSVDDALRQALREPSFLMTPEHWERLRQPLLEKNPELRAE